METQPLRAFQPAVNPDLSPLLRRQYNPEFSPAIAARMCKRLKIQGRGQGTQSGGGILRDVSEVPLETQPLAPTRQMDSEKADRVEDHPTAGRQSPRPTTARRPP